MLSDKLPGNIDLTVLKSSFKLDCSKNVDSEADNTLKDIEVNLNEVKLLESEFKNALAEYKSYNYSDSLKLFMKVIDVSVQIKQVEIEKNAVKYVCKLLLLKRDYQKCMTYLERLDTSPKTLNILVRCLMLQYENSKNQKLLYVSKHLLYLILSYNHKMQLESNLSDSENPQDSENPEDFERFEKSLVSNTNFVFKNNVMLLRVFWELKEYVSYYVLLDKMETFLEKDSSKVKNKHKTLFRMVKNYAKEDDKIKRRKVERRSERLLENQRKAELAVVKKLENKKYDVTPDYKVQFVAEICKSLFVEDMKLNIDGRTVNDIVQQLLNFYVKLEKLTVGPFEKCVSIELTSYTVDEVVMVSDNEMSGSNKKLPQTRQGQRDVKRRFIALEGSSTKSIYLKNYWSSVCNFFYLNNFHYSLENSFKTNSSHRRDDEDGTISLDMIYTSDIARYLKYSGGYYSLKLMRKLESKNRKLLSDKSRVQMLRRFLKEMSSSVYSPVSFSIRLLEFLLGNYHLVSSGSNNNSNNNTNYLVLLSHVYDYVNKSLVHKERFFNNNSNTNGNYNSNRNNTKSIKPSSHNKSKENNKKSDENKDFINTLDNAAINDDSNYTNSRDITPTSSNRNNSELNSNVNSDNIGDINTPTNINRNTRITRSSSSRNTNSSISSNSSKDNTPTNSKDNDYNRDDKYVENKHRNLNNTSFTKDILVSNLYKYNNMFESECCHVKKFKEINEKYGIRLLFGLCKNQNDMSRSKSNYLNTNTSSTSNMNYTNSTNYTSYTSNTNPKGIFSSSSDSSPKAADMKTKLMNRVYYTILFNLYKLCKDDFYKKIHILYFYVKKLRNEKMEVNKCVHQLMQQYKYIIQYNKCSLMYNKSLKIMIVNKSKAKKNAENNRLIRNNNKDNNTKEDNNNNNNKENKDNKRSRSNNGSRDNTPTSSNTNKNRVNSNVDCDKDGNVNEYNNIYNDYGCWKYEYMRILRSKGLSFRNTNMCLDRISKLNNIRNRNQKIDRYMDKLFNKMGNFVLSEDNLEEQLKKFVKKFFILFVNYVDLSIVKHMYLLKYGELDEEEMNYISSVYNKYMNKKNNSNLFYNELQEFLVEVTRYLCTNEVLPKWIDSLLLFYSDLLTVISFNLHKNVTNLQINENINFLSNVGFNHQFLTVLVSTLLVIVNRLYYYKYYHLLSRNCYEDEYEYSNSRDITPTNSNMNNTSKENDICNVNTPTNRNRNTRITRRSSRLNTPTNSNSNYLNSNSNNSNSSRDDDNNSNGNGNCNNNEYDQEPFLKCLKEVELVNGYIMVLNSIVSRIYTNSVFIIYYLVNYLILDYSQQHSKIIYYMYVNLSQVVITILSSFFNITMLTSNNDSSNTTDNNNTINVSNNNNNSKENSNSSRGVKLELSYLLSVVKDDDSRSSSINSSDSSSLNSFENNMSGNKEEDDNNMDNNNTSNTNTDVKENDKLDDNNTNDNGNGSRDNTPTNSNKNRLNNNNTTSSYKKNKNKDKDREVVILNRNVMEFYYTYNGILESLFQIDLLFRENEITLDGELVPKKLRQFIDLSKKDGSEFLEYNNKVNLNISSSIFNKLSQMFNSEFIDDISKDLKIIYSNKHLMNEYNINLVKQFYQKLNSDSNYYISNKSMGNKELSNNSSKDSTLTNGNINTINNTNRNNRIVDNRNTNKNRVNSNVDEYNEKRKLKENNHVRPLINDLTSKCLNNMIGKEFDSPISILMYVHYKKNDNLDYTYLFKSLLDKISMPYVEELCLFDIYSNPFITFNMSKEIFKRRIEQNNNKEDNNNNHNSKENEGLVHSNTQEICDFVHTLDNNKNNSSNIKEVNDGTSGSNTSNNTNTTKDNDNSNNTSKENNSIEKDSKDKRLDLIIELTKDPRIVPYVNYVDKLNEIVSGEHMYNYNGLVKIYNNYPEYDFMETHKEYYLKLLNSFGSIDSLTTFDVESYNPQYLLNQLDALNHASVMMPNNYDVLFLALIKNFELFLSVLDNKLFCEKYTFYSSSILGDRTSMLRSDINSNTSTSKDNNNTNNSKENENNMVIELTNDNSNMNENGIEDNNTISDFNNTNNNSNNNNVKENAKNKNKQKNKEKDKDKESKNDEKDEDDEASVNTDNVEKFDMYGLVKRILYLLQVTLHKYTNLMVTNGYLNNNNHTNGNSNNSNGYTNGYTNGCLNNCNGYPDVNLINGNGNTNGYVDPRFIFYGEYESIKFNEKDLLDVDSYSYKLNNRVKLMHFVRITMLLYLLKKGKLIPAGLLISDYYSIVRSLKANLALNKTPELSKGIEGFLNYHLSDSNIYNDNDYLYLRYLQTKIFERIVKNVPLQINMYVSAYIKILLNYRDYMEILIHNKSLSDNYIKNGNNNTNNCNNNNKNNKSSKSNNRRGRKASNGNNTNTSIKTNENNSNTNEDSNKDTTNGNNENGKENEDRNEGTVLVKSETDDNTYSASNNTDTNNNTNDNGNDTRDNTPTNGNSDTSSNNNNNKENKENELELENDFSGFNHEMEQDNKNNKKSKKLPFSLYNIDHFGYDSYLEECEFSATNSMNYLNKVFYDRYTTDTMDDELIIVFYKLHMARLRLCYMSPKLYYLAVPFSFNPRYNKLFNDECASQLFNKRYYQEWALLIEQRCETFKIKPEHVIEDVLRFLNMIKNSSDNDIGCMVCYKMAHFYYNVGNVDKCLECLREMVQKIIIPDELIRFAMNFEISFIKSCKKILTNTCWILITTCCQVAHDSKMIQDIQTLEFKKRMNLIFSNKQEEDSNTTSSNSNDNSNNSKENETKKGKENHKDKDNHKEENKKAKQKVKTVRKGESSWVFSGLGNISRLDRMCTLIEIHMSMLQKINKKFKTLYENRNNTLLLSTLNYVQTLIINALTYSFMVLVYSCPHALSLSVMANVLDKEDLAALLKTQNVVRTKPVQARIMADSLYDMITNKAEMDNVYEYLERKKVFYHASISAEYNIKTATLDLRIMKQLFMLWNLKLFRKPVEINNKLSEIFIDACNRLLYLVPYDHNMLNNPQDIKLPSGILVKISDEWAANQRITTIQKASSAFNEALNKQS